MRRRTFLTGAALFVAGCRREASMQGALGTPRSRPRIIATTGMVADILRHVVGDCGEVAGLLGESVDPHIYQPNRGDMKRLGESDLVFYSGLNLEGKFGDAFAQVRRSGKPVVAVTEQLDKEYLRFPQEYEGHADPHVWMDVKAWSLCVEEVAKHLVEALPEHSEEFRANAAAYRGSLEKLDEYARQTLATIPESQRVLVTAHDAFGYFARAYGLEVRSPQGLSTESSPGVDDIVRIVDFLVERKIQSIFVESSVSEDNIRAILEGAESKGHKVSLAGPLYSDAMGPAGQYEGTYVGMIDHNVTLIARSLGGQAPERGMQGKLTVATQAD